MSPTFSADYVSVKNATSDKPNEDAVGVDETRGIFVVADGVSRLRGRDGSYPSPSPAAQAAQILVDESMRFLRDYHDRSEQITYVQLIEALVAANKAIAHYNQHAFPTPDFGINDYAGAVGIIAYVFEKTCIYAYIGDCLGFHFKTSERVALTVNQTEGIEAYLTAHKNTDQIEQIVRREIRNNRDHPLGWGVLTGEEKAQHFIRSGQLTLTAGDRLLFCTDGMLAAVNNGAQLSRKSSARELVEQVSELEQNGTIRTDDKTVIIVDIQ
jgi:serine/threonine protein phosphatase PrpC